MAILTVGTDKDYITIQGAVNAASNGDTVLIDSGDYNEVVTVTNKILHFLGNIIDPRNDPVVSLVGIRFYDLNYVYPITVVIENLFLNFKTAAADYIGFYLNNCNNTHLIINRCGYTTTVADGYAYYKRFNYIYSNCTRCSMVIRNSNFYHSSSWTSYSYFGYNSSSSSCIISLFRLYTERLLLTYNVAKLDYSYSEAYTFGQNYGSAFLELPTQYKFSGQVTEFGIPVSRAVKAFRRDTNAYIGGTQSDAVTGLYTLVTSYSGIHQLICQDNSESPMFNDKIISQIVPSTLSEYNQWEVVNNKITITLSYLDVDATIYNVPLVLYLNAASGKTDFDATDIFNNLNQDIYKKRFSIQQQGKNKELFCEILKWDLTTNEAVLWVVVNELSSTEDTVLTLYYDRNLQDNALYISENGSGTSIHVWEGGVGIYNLNYDPTGGPSSSIDSSLYKFNATPNNFTSLDYVDGYFYKALDFSGTKNVSVASHTLVDPLSSNCCLFAMVNFDTLSGTQPLFYTGDYYEGHGIGLSDGNLTAVSVNNFIATRVTYPVTTISAGEWYEVGASFDSASPSIKLYLEGTVVAEGTTSYTAANDTDHTLHIGYSAAGSPIGSYFEPTPIVTSVSGTVFAFDFEGSPGANADTVYDVTGNAEMWDYNSTGGTFSSAAKISGDTSLYLTSSNKYYLTTSGSATSLGVNDFTFSFWIYLPSTTTNWFFSSVNTSFLVGWNGTGIYISSNGSTWDIANNKFFGNQTAGTWSHYALVRDNLTFYVYREGALIDSFYSNLGVYPFSTTCAWSNGWTGYVDDLLLINGTAIHPDITSLGVRLGELDAKVSYAHMFNTYRSTNWVSLRYKSIKDTLFTFSS